MNDEYDLQSQLDSNMGSDYNSDLGDNSQQGLDYLQNQQNWDFGNYGDQWSSVPQQQQQFDMSNFQQQQPQQSFAPDSLSAQMQQWQPQQYDMSTNGGQMPNMGSSGFGGATNFLQNLFSGNSGKLLTTGLGALLEGNQNKRQAQGMQNIVNQQQARQSPFDTAGGADPTSMRGQMQQALTQTMQNPYGQPMVKAQVDQIARAQAIKDAAAGRRSNSATSSPAMLAAQAKVAQEYMNSLQNPAGANIAPSSTGIEQLIAALKYGTQGYGSPLMSAVGYNQGVKTNSTAQNSSSDALLAAIQKLTQGQS